MSDTDGAEISADTYTGVSCVVLCVLLAVPEYRQGPNARSCTPRWKGCAGGVVDCNG